jgi:predicted nucleotidyltransferase
MGMRIRAVKPRRTKGLADALFSRTQQKVLALLFGQPDRSFYATELITLVGAGSGAVQRELAKLEQSGLVTSRRIGNQKHYQANRGSPLFAELSAIVRKTVAVAEPLREALHSLASDISAAFVYGSIAKKSDTSRSHIDLMIVSDKLTYADIYAALEPFALAVNRKVNPTIYTRLELSKRIRAGNAFVRRVLEQPKVWVIGTEHDLAA